jgi:hypothetical protein
MSEKYASFSDCQLYLRFGFRLRFVYEACHKINARVVLFDEAEAAAFIESARVGGAEWARA